MPERLRGSTRNRIRNACVGSNPAVCVFFFCSSRLVARHFFFATPMDDYYCGDDLTFGKKTKEKRKKKKRKISKKKEKGKKIIATKNPSSSLISTHTSSRKRYANALSPSLSRKSRSVSFPRFLDARKRAVFLAFFFRARHTPHAFARAKRRWWVDYPRKKNKKNNHHRIEVCACA